MARTVAADGGGKEKDWMSSKTTVADILRAMKEAEGGSVEIAPDGQVYAVPPLRRADVVATIDGMKLGAKITIRETWPSHDGSARTLILDGYLLACDALLGIFQPARGMTTGTTATATEVFGDEEPR